MKSLNKEFLWRTIWLGARSLLLHKLRSSLTMLGIIFGVCSVITMLAIGEGASKETQERLKKMGSSNIIINSQKPAEAGKQSASNSKHQIEYGLTYNDISRFQKTIPGIDRVLPMRIIRENIRFGENQEPSRVIGTLSTHHLFEPINLIAGRFLTDIDELYQRNVCVLDVNSAKRLFPYQDPLVSAVKIVNDYYQVIGLVESPGNRKGKSSQNSTNRVYIPLSTARVRFGETLFRSNSGGYSLEKVELHRAIIKMKDPDMVIEAKAQSEAILKRFHKKNDYELIVPLQLILAAKETKRIFNIVLGSIAAISLLVGGIGIMNIMLASVTERTKEIGIRRALGAKRKDITIQFLVETLILSLGGGLIGVMLGILIPSVISKVTQMEAVITLWSILIAFGISALTGIIFGIYPASKAARLDPIEALRHD